jgi:DNA-binding LacI/PurR family transcriptional regulator
MDPGLAHNGQMSRGGVTRKPTVYDVAARAGVSIATVSFTFRQPARVKEPTRLAVEAAAKELGYIPSASARGLAGGRTGALGLLTRAYRPTDPVLGDSAGSAEDDPNADCRLFPLYFDEIGRGVEEECWRRGYAVMLAGATNSNSEAVLTDIAGRVDGLVILSGAVSDHELERIAERLRVVVVSDPDLAGSVPHVAVDNAGGMRAVVEHLVEAHRLRRMAFVGAVDDSDRRERYATFRSTLHDAGLPAPDRPIAITVDPRARPRDPIDRDALPEAFVCENDEVALGVMDALRDLGVNVPGEVAVTGFDGIVAGRLATPRLTTARQPLTRMGAEAVSLLFDRIEHPQEPTVARYFPARLVVRECCGCPAA